MVRRIVNGFFLLMSLVFLIDMFAHAACTTDPLWRLLEIGFVFVLTPLVLIGNGETDD